MARQRFVFLIIDCSFKKNIYTTVIVTFHIWLPGWEYMCLRSTVVWVMSLISLAEVQTLGLMRLPCINVNADFIFCSSHTPSLTHLCVAYIRILPGRGPLQTWCSTWDKEQSHCKSLSSQFSVSTAGLVGHCDVNQPTALQESPGSAWEPRLWYQKTVDKSSQSYLKPFPYTFTVFTERSWNGYLKILVAHWSIAREFHIAV